MRTPEEQAPKQVGYQGHCEQRHRTRHDADAVLKSRLA